MANLSTQPYLLIVEDHAESLDEITNALEAYGYTIHGCPSYSALGDYLIPMEGEPVEYAAILSDYNLGQGQDRTGKNVFQFAWRTLHGRKVPFIASSTEMENWEEIKDVFKLNLIPKVSGHWDANAVIAKLIELGIIP